MKRDEITAIFPDATKEQLDQIMAINGADVQHAKKSVDDLKAQISEANNTIESMKADANELKRLQGIEQQYTEMQHDNEIREIREKVSRETGVPAHLLTGDTEEDCTAWANNLKDYAKPSAYPKVPNGGEPNNPSAAPTTAEQFAEWSKNVF